jgi:hypothetical protein
MKQISFSAFAFAIICLLLTAPWTGDAQTPDAIYHSDIFAVTISMEMKAASASQSPIVRLAIRNISQEPISRDDCSSDPRVWVQGEHGEHGEPPTTYRERFSTMRLLPGEPELPCTLNNTWSIAPGQTYVKHILLKYLYDLQEPGKYSVYVEFPVRGRWLRTNTVDFQLTPEESSREKRDAAPPANTDR